MKILFFGDVVGKSGRGAVAKILPELKKQYEPDLVIANAENVAHGKGVTIHTVSALFDAGVDSCTSGNHAFDKPDVKSVFEQFPDRIIRPANLPENLPGKGMAVLNVQGHLVMIANLNGRVFMEKQFDFGQIDNPFTKLDAILAAADPDVKIRLLDFHAEATSEKRGMGLYADGKLSCVLGTHTHVQTNDAQVLPNGTGYLSDLGMVGAAGSIIGVKAEGSIKRLMKEGEGGTRPPIEIDESDRYETGFALITIDERTGKCQNIRAELRIENLG